MKPIKVLLSLVIVVAVLFASTLSAAAIGFEAEAVYESVFVIRSGNSMGSGFAMGANCVVTNAHVIGNPKNITVETYGGARYQAFVLGMDAQLDIAVLVVPEAQFPTLQPVHQFKTGDDIYAIGAPKGMAYTLTKGGISAKERTIRGQTYIQIDAPINEGNSGGPLLNDAGQVLGMNTLKMSDAEGIGLAIPIVRICLYLQDLRIELDAQGNVYEALPTPTEPTEPETTPRPEKTESYEPDAFRDFPGLVVITACSLLTNAILAGVLILKRKKQSVTPYDPSERTDFDIDILE